MFNRTSTQATQHSAPASRLPFLAALVLLTVAVLSFEAKAQDLQVASIAAPEAQVEEQGVWEDYQQSNLTGLNLDTQFLNDGAAADDGDYARVVRIASCHEASLARYNSDSRDTSANDLPKLNDFRSSMTGYTAMKNSQHQFDTCSK